MKRILYFAIATLMMGGSVGLGQEIFPQQPCAMADFHVLRVERPNNDWSLGLVNKGHILKTFAFHQAPNAEQGFVGTAYAALKKPILALYHRR
jgi:hypothetical protein